VAVDIRRGSSTFGNWVGAILSSENHHQLYIPEGFAHGFCVTSETAVCLYKCTDYYAPREERGIRWDDPLLKITWPVSAPLLSDKDQVYPTLDTISRDDLPGFKPSLEEGVPVTHFQAAADDVKLSKTSSCPNL